MKPCCVFQDWVLQVPSMQQQSVLILPCRGPDGLPKSHPCKLVVAHYRATVLKSAKFGTALTPGQNESHNTFMTLRDFSDAMTWFGVLQKFFHDMDQLPHHYLMHLAHGAQIIGFKHPDSIFRARWGLFYQCFAEALHMQMETEAQMDKRLGDWDRQYWPEPAKKNAGGVVTGRMPGVPHG